MNAKHQNSQVSLNYLVPEKACMDILQDMACLRIEGNKRVISGLRSVLAQRMKDKYAIQNQQNADLGNAIKNARSLGNNDLLKSSIKPWK